DDVRRADEAGDELRGRALVHLRRRPDLLDAAQVEDGEVVAHRQGLLLVVRDVQERHSEIALERLEEDLHLLAELEVERAGRLVISSPPRRTEPRSGRSKPAISRSVVVLPEPDGPSSVKNSPSPTRRSTLSTATTSP